MTNSISSDAGAFAAIFDLDGTLVDTADDLAAALNFVLEDAGRAPLPLASVRGLVGAGARALVERGFEDEPASDDALTKARVDQLVDYYAANIAVRSKPFPGVMEAIDELAAQGARFAICTNKREALATSLVSALGLDRIFTVVIGADTLPTRKPDPAPVLACLDRLGVPRGVFFGDSDTDIKAAQAARTPCLAFNGGYGPLSLRDNAFAVFSDYEKAPQLVAAALRASV
ncbi:MAG: HAD-IA family hydrolase [Pseudomonadota bacterium]